MTRSHLRTESPAMRGSSSTDSHLLPASAAHTGVAVLSKTFVSHSVFGDPSPFRLTVRQKIWDFVVK